MVDYTYEASRTSQYRYGGDFTPVTLSTGSGHGPHPFKGDCPEHGIHSALELDRPFTIEKEDDEWRLPEKYNVSYCEECVAERRGEAKLLNADSLEDAIEDGEAGIREVVLDLIELNWRYLRTPFEPSDLGNRETVQVDEIEEGESILEGDHV